MNSSVSPDVMIPVLHAVTRRFGAHTVLNKISLSLLQGSITCLLGPSGCGKSTLLRVAASLLPADEGSVLIDPREAAMVFQEPRLLPWLTVAENLALALHGKERGQGDGVSRAEAARRIREALALVELGDISRLLPRELSGGMAQRVGLARSLLRRPRYLLMDEPFAALDAITRGVLQKMLTALIAEQKITCLFVTHDIDEALRIGRHIHVMKNGAITLDCRADDHICDATESDATPHDRKALKERILVCLQKTENRKPKDTP